MSKTVKIGNQDQLRAFLRILAEESYSQAKTDVDDERKHQSAVARAAKRDIGAFMKEEDDPTSPAAPKPPAPEAPPTDLGASEEPAALPAPKAEPKPAPPAPTEPIEPSFDAVTRAILDLRSGKSVKDSAIEAELEAYYDRLNDAERYSMIIFLRALSDIVTGKQMGGQAPEPSTAPHNISITRPEAQGAPETPAEPPPAVPSPEEDLTAAPPPPEEKPEPSAGPIQVGSPVSEAFRAHIRRLILANR